VYDAGDNLIDPYAGPCNSLNASSWWASQRPYYDSAINAVLTHSAAPVFPACPTTETLNTSNTFVPGQDAYFAAYYRDQLSGQVSNYYVYDAIGNLVASWSHSSPAAHYAASYWYWYFALPGGYALGKWRFDVVYQGQTYSHDFFVVDPTAVEETPAAPGLALIRVGSASGPVELEYRVPSAGQVRLEVFDVRGRRVAGLVDGWRPAGVYRSTWETSRDGGTGSGVYFAKCTFGGAAVTEAITIVH
jgi:hypothetical protein